MTIALYHLVAWFTLNHWTLLLNLRYHFVGIVDPHHHLHRIGSVPHIHIGTAVTVHN
jgi:hypothetical protein